MDKSPPSDALLYFYLVRLAVLAHCVSQPRQNNGSNGQQTAAKKASLDSIPLPKGTVKALKNHFKSLATTQTALSGLSQEQAFRRRVYLALYAQLLEMKQTDASGYDDVCRRLEALMARFMICVSKEMVNFPNLGPQKSLVNREGAQFIDMIRSVVSNQLKQSSVPPQLETQLVEYKNSHFDEPNEPANLKKAADSELSRTIARICLVSSTQIQNDISALVPSSVVAGAKRDLQALLTSLERLDLGRSDEAIQLKAQIASLSGGSSSSIEFLPPNPGAYFSFLVKRVLDADMSKDELTQSSLGLLTEASRWWHILPSTAAAYIVHSAHEIVAQTTRNTEVKDEGSLLTVLGDAIDFAGSMATIATSGSRLRNWPRTEARMVETGLDALRQSIIYKMAAILKTICQDKKPPKLGPYLHCLGSLHVADLDLTAATPSHIKQLKQAIIKSAETSYDEYLGQLPRDSSLDISHIVALAQTIVAGIEKLQKRYKKPLLDELPIAKLVCVRQVGLFGTDFLPMYDHCTQVRAADDDASDFNDIKALHAELSQMEGLLEQCGMGEGFRFDVEGTLFPYFLSWAESTVALSRTFVEPAIAQDTFDPIDDVVRHSSSVKDLFSSYYSTLQLIERLEWRNQYHVAKLLTKVMSGVASSLCDWAGKLHLMFLEDIRPVLSNNTASSGGSLNTRNRERWLAMAKDAVASAQAVASEAAGRYSSIRAPAPAVRFGSHACVKLNDIASAYSLLNKMEESVNSDAVAKRIEKEERLKGKKSTSSSYLFTVIVVGAQNLRSYNGGTYVTLIDQDTRKRLGKTRTVLNGPNPKWSQPFELEVGAGRPRLLKATVWDENLASNHELCGRALVKLDPKEFSIRAGTRDYGTRVSWFDLDTEGRLQVQVSMDLRRDDIRFFFGQALRYLKRTQEDMITAMVHQFAGYIENIISLPTLRGLVPSRASASLQTLNAWWSSTTGTGAPQQPSQGVSVTARIEDTLQPLFDYLNDNFSTLALVLTDELRVEVMGRTWDCVLEQIELLIVPPLESRRCSQQPLSAGEMEAVYTWLSSLRDFFHAGGAGPDLERLQSQAYQQIMAIPVYYDLPIAQLRAESEKITRQGLRTYTHNAEMMMRQHTVMAHRSRTVIERQAAEIRQAQRAAPRLDEVVLRILRLRGDIPFIEQQLRQRERLLQKETTERAIQGLN